MVEQISSVEIIRLNSVLCSMDISKLETIDLTISDTFNDTNLKSCETYLTQSNSMCVTSRVEPKESVIIVLDEPMDIVDKRAKFLPNIKEDTIDFSHSFITYRNKSSNRESDRFQHSIIEHTLLNRKDDPKENELETVGNDEQVEHKRTLRKRICHFGNRNEDKVKVKKVNNVTNVKKYYLDKKVKRLPSTLETIFEEPKQENEQEMYLGARKLKRTLTFDDSILKSRKRLKKAKKLATSKKYLSRKKISMETLMNKLISLESND